MSTATFDELRSQASNSNVNVKSEYQDRGLSSTDLNNTVHFNLSAADLESETPQEYFEDVSQMVADMVDGKDISNKADVYVQSLHNLLTELEYQTEDTFDF